MKRRGALVSQQGLSGNPKGKPCAYCHRTMRGLGDRTLLGATRDHVIPKSAGGTKMIWACRACNNIKGNMMPDEWRRFMGANPKWWKLATPSRRFRERGELPPHRFSRRIEDDYHITRAKSDEDCSDCAHWAVRPVHPRATTGTIFGLCAVSGLETEDEDTCPFFTSDENEPLVPRT